MVRLDHYDDDGEREKEEDKIAMCSTSWQKVFFFFLINDIYVETTGRCSDLCHLSACILSAPLRPRLTSFSC